jgi:multicomponent Na+:H+ antiporter subunit B
VSPRTRQLVALGSLAVLGAALAAAVLDLPGPDDPHGPYAKASIALLTAHRHVTNIVTGITFDLRGIDTLGEELILFCAAVGSTLLLRAQRDEHRAEQARDRADEQREKTPPSVRALGAAMVGPLLVLGAYIVLHGPLTPGGGFQGGVLLAAALLGAYAAGQLLALERVRPISLVELAEAVGAAAYVLVALGGIVFAGTAMASFLPAGTQGSLVSGGIIPLLNLAVGVEVAGAITLILTEFLDQALLRSASER